MNTIVVDLSEESCVYHMQKQTELLAALAKIIGVPVEFV